MTPLLLLFLVRFSTGLYFHFLETERKCFIEEIPDDTMASFFLKILHSHTPVPGFRSRSRGIWLEPSRWPGYGSTLNICLIIHEIEFFLSKHKLWPTCTGTFVSYFRHFVVSFQKFQNSVLFYQEPEPAPDKKFPESEPPQNRPAPKPCTVPFYSLRSFS